ncbi:hypothetical protein AYL99_00732 [Fonsecaea erecta]|uniref:Myocyte-specific enhancer factor 2d n=1 Tax=Fonsecaea erecta TaxID=1367422 RepID=A0A178ZY22_9EURO|nr:hypothetical protein AYL99_00732 [Fonsecaea erecta]OAP64760.1 hypothetical protein AYL99_00732 [Fonsecaea erecta]
MPADLPGYHFDPVKNRYFKIQPNHIAPSGSNYSVQAVRAEEAIKDAQREDELLYRSKLAITPRRSKLLQHPMLEFDRRLGHLRKSAGALVSEYYAAGLTGMGVFPDVEFKPPSSWDPLGPDSGSFAIAESSGTLFADCVRKESGHSMYQRQRSTHMCAFHLRPRPLDDPNHDPHWYVPGNYETSAPYQYSNTRWYDVANSPRCILALEYDLVVWCELITHRGAPTTSVVKIGGGSREFAYRTERIPVQSVVWGLAAQPGEYRAAMVCETGFSLLDLSAVDHPISRFPMDTNEMLQATFKDHNIVLCGTRSGQILMCDIRAPAQHSDLDGYGGVGATSGTRLQHSDTVNDLAALPDGNCIIASGPRQMSIYDLRFAPPPTRVCHMPRAKSFQASPAVLDFVIPKTYATRLDKTNFTYDPELNIVLRTSTDNYRNHRAALWSARTGRLLDSPLNTTVFEEPIVCAAIARIRDGPKSVFISADREITEWTPQGRGGEGEDDQE